MSDTDKAKAEKAQNYSAEQIALITAQSPMDFEQARILGLSFEPVKSARSIVAKIKSLELDYICKPAPVKKPKPITKSELVDQIAENMEVDSGLFAGLEKATVSALNNLLDCVQFVEAD